jgi:glycine/D-amino acid oxidase-like deaminating enzyme
MDLGTTDKKDHHADVLIIGGGIVGSAVAFGIAETGARTIMLDEGDRAFRAARGNFGLVWYQGKGQGMRRYQEWSLEATRLWPDFAEKLQAKTGIDVSYRKPGGFNFCVGDGEYESRRNLIEKIRREAAPEPYDCRMMDRKTLQELLPDIKLGDGVVGASYSAHDGHVNPLALLRALHAGIKSLGGYYFPGHPVFDIAQSGDRFILKTPGGSFTAPKLVIAAGNGTGRLAQMVGINMPVRPEKGEILATERTAPCLPFPCNRIQQTAEGSFLLGASQEDSGFDVQIKTRVIQDISSRAKKVFPVLGKLKIVRSWAALRVLTPDKMPIYETSGSSPEVFAIALHSGVTLASLHATRLPEWILDGRPPRGFHNFRARRFHV